MFLYLKKGSNEFRAFFIILVQDEIHFETCSVPILHLRNHRICLTHYFVSYGIAFFNPIW